MGNQKWFWQFHTNERSQHKVFNPDGNAVDGPSILLLTLCLVHALTAWCLQQMTTGLSQMQGQILTHQGGTYLVQSNTMDGEGHPLTHTTRASPATVSREQMASEPGPSTSSTSSSSSNTEHTRLLLLTTERRLGTSSEGDICFGEPGLALAGAGVSQIICSSGGKTHDVCMSGQMLFVLHMFLFFFLHSNLLRFSF